MPYRRFALFLPVLFLFSACGHEYGVHPSVDAHAEHQDEHASEFAGRARPSLYPEFLAIVPPMRELNSEHDVRLAQLGERLFHDPRLSGKMDVSCASCHQLTRGGADGLPVSVGTQGQRSKLNAPTVLNASLNFRQFWDGRAKDLLEQVDGPIENPTEMAGQWPVIVERLKLDDAYRLEFAALFEDGITPDNVRTSLVRFQEYLITPNSRFDQYILGDKSAFSYIEQRGFQRFRELGCSGCHQGVNVGGNSYQYMGLVENYFEDRGDLKPSDYGLYNQTGRPEDRFKFKVPALRNVSQTAPYFHDGSAVSLRDAIFRMAYYQLGFELSERDLTEIEAFLKTLDAPALPIAKGLSNNNDAISNTPAGQVIAQTKMESR